MSSSNFNFNFNSDSIQLEPSWKKYLLAEFSKDYMVQLKKFLETEIKIKHKNIFPKGSEIFNAFELTPFDQVKIVILGQDPYHQPGQAHGLCFSVLPGVPHPPSLENIFKERQEDLGIKRPLQGRGCLADWAKQGVLLLNSVLTVEASKAGSHQNKGWEIFTDQVIFLLNQYKKNLVFILWGSYAQNKGKIIDQNKHKLICSAHPSPLSAYRGFFGSRPFSKTNQYLAEHGLGVINW